MKRIILAASVLLLSGIQTFAQTEFLKGLAFKAGYVYNPLNFKNKENPGLSENLAFNGFTLGADYTVPELLGPLDLTFGVSYTFLGQSENSSDEIGGGTVTIKESILDNYIEVPVRISYSYNFDKFQCFVYAGPKFDFGVGGKASISTHIKGPGMQESHTEKAPLYGEDATFIPFQMYLGAGIGVVLLDHYRLTLGYDGGIINRAKGDLRKEITILNPTQINIGVAYVF